MPLYFIPSPIPKSDSKPIDPRKHSLIKLPAQTRNHIFGYLFEYSEPVAIELRNISRARHLHLGAGFEMHKNLFLACGTTYLEAASLFYVSNTFVINPINPKSRDTIEHLLDVYIGRMAPETGVSSILAPQLLH